MDEVLPVPPVIGDSASFQTCDLGPVHGDWAIRACKGTVVGLSRAGIFLFTRSASEAGGHPRWAGWGPHLEIRPQADLLTGLLVLALPVILPHL